MRKTENTPIVVDKAVNQMRLSSSSSEGASGETSADNNNNNNSDATPFETRPTEPPEVVTQRLFHEQEEHHDLLDTIHPDD